MANWTGTVAIANSTGTLTSADASTATNSGASWPTVGIGLANCYIRILTGTGASTTPVLISSNTAQVLTLGAAWPNGTPDATSTYEIVIILKNNDHITGNLLFSTGTIIEIEDSATVYVDGNYYIKFTSTTCVIRWAKTESTIATFCKNERSVSGISGAWGYIWPAAAFTTPAQIQFIKIQDTQGGLPLSAQDTTDIHHVWIDGLTLDTGFNNGAMAQDMSYKNFFFQGLQESLGFSCTGNYTATYDTCYFRGIGSCIWTAAGNIKQVVRDCVFTDPASTGYVDNSAGQTYQLQDSYFSETAISQRLIGSASAAAAGTYILSRNLIKNVRSIYSGHANSATAASAFNDVAPPYIRSNSYAYTDVVATNFTSLTSDNDFISGQLAALSINIDTTEATTSTASPKQYKYLTSARTNAKAVRNKPFTIDNVVVSDITTDTATLTFDCANGAVAGQGSTTVDDTSAAGQPTLLIADTTGFQIDEIVEVGYGTVRQEFLEVLSISAGVSLTFKTNLAYEHTAAQADTVKKQLRHLGLPFVVFGTTSGNHVMSTPVICPSYWGPIYTGLMTSFEGMPVAFKRVGHSISLSSLEPGTTYYFRACALSPLQDKMESTTEGSFTTDSDGGTSETACTFVS